MSAIVLAPGTLSHIQDGGRRGAWHLGLTEGGAADGNAAYWANALLGNDAGAALIECSMGGLHLRFEASTWVVVTGAQAPVLTNQVPIEMWRPQLMTVGDELCIGYPRAGLHVYVAVLDGWQIPSVMGSVATVLREGIGGIEGRALQRGDRLPMAESTRRPVLQRLCVTERPRFESTVQLRVIPGYQWRDFSSEQRRQFWQAEYLVSPHSNRMGVRLSGEPIVDAQRNMLSEGINLGAIQITPEGLPIVMLSERQTMGGYPKMGSVLEPDCWRLAQATPGTRVQFVPVTSDSARRGVRAIGEGRRGARLWPIENAGLSRASSVP